MGTTVDDLQAFEEVHKQTDWPEFSSLPAFKEVNRKDAYQAYLSLEAKMLENYATAFLKNTHSLSVDCSAEKL
jgi:hypothetical protein